MSEEAVSAELQERRADVAAAFDAVRAAGHEAIRRAHVRSFFWSALIWLPLGFFIGWGMR